MLSSMAGLGAILKFDVINSKGSHESISRNEVETLAIGWNTPLNRETELVN